MVKESREHWLVLSYWANVDGMACSHHIDDRLKHLARLGVEAEVITGTCGPRPGGWGRRWHRVPSVTATGYQFEVRQLTRRLRKPWRRLVRLLLTLPVLPLYSMEKHVARLHSTFWWCISAAAAGLWSTRNGRHELIYSTGGEMSAHVAAALVARVRRLPWIAEMQDPIVYQGFGRSSFSRYVARRVERLVHSEAAAVVYVTETAAHRAKLRTNGRARCLVIRPGAEPLSRLGARERGSKMQVMHVGTLRRDRQAETLLEALRRLAVRLPEARDEIKVSLIGRMDGPTRRAMERFPWPNMVTIVGEVGRDLAHAETMEADLLLLIQHNSPVSAETIPSKLCEYLLSGRPVLGLIHHNPELEALLVEAGHECAEVDDVPGIERALERAHERWRKGALYTRPSLPYTAEGAARNLIEWSCCLRGSEAEERRERGNQ